MPSDIFKDIVTLEKEIRERLADEQQKADAWLAEQYAALDQDLQNQLQSLKNTTCQEKAAAIGRAEKEAAEIIATATRRAADLKKTEEKRMQEVISSKLAAILPGAS